MSLELINKETVNVPLEDDCGNPLFTVPVTITYVVEIDSNYGADADGRRGVRREEVHLLDTEIPRPIMMQLAFYQIEYVIARAYEQVTKGVRT